MTTYARIENDLAIDVCADPRNNYHPALAAQFVTVPADVSVGSRRDPESGQWYPPGWLLDEEGTWTAPVAVSPSVTDERANPTLVITAIEADADNASKTLMDGVSDITCPVGTVLTFRAELRDASDNVLPLSGKFRMPLRSRDGREKVLLAELDAGEASICVPLRESGAWSVSESMINEGLPVGQQMSFAGVRIFVVEA